MHYLNNEENVSGKFPHELGNRGKSSPNERGLFLAHFQKNGGIANGIKSYVYEYNLSKPVHNGHACYDA